MAHTEAQAIMARVVQAGALRVTSCSDGLHDDVNHVNEGDCSLMLQLNVVVKELAGPCLCNDSAHAMLPTLITEQHYAGRAAFAQSVPIVHTVAYNIILFYKITMIVHTSTYQ